MFPVGLVMCVSNLSLHSVFILVLSRSISALPLGNVGDCSHSWPSVATLHLPVYGMIPLIIHSCVLRIVLQGQELLTSNMMVSTSTTLCSDNLAVFSRFFSSTPFETSSSIKILSIILNPLRAEFTRKSSPGSGSFFSLPGRWTTECEQYKLTVASLAMIDLPHGCDQRRHSVVEYPSELARRYVRLVSSRIQGVLRLLLFSRRNPILFASLLFLLPFIRMAFQLVPHSATQADDLLIDRAD